MAVAKVREKRRGFVHRGNLCLGRRLLPLEDAAGARFTARFLVAADSTAARARLGLFSHIFVLVDPARSLVMIEKRTEDGSTYQLLPTMLMPLSSAWR